MINNEDAFYTKDFALFSDIYEQIMEAPPAENEEIILEGVTVSGAGDVPDQYIERMRVKPECVVIKEEKESVILRFCSMAKYLRFVCRQHCWCNRIKSNGKEREMSHAIETAAHSLIGSLGEMASIMVSTGDERHGEQLLEFRGKLSESLLTVAFCGHFSAGKSTLVNRLCGRNLLPSSPIPTSANVVKIVNGESKAIITKLVHGQAQQLRSTH